MFGRWSQESRAKIDSASSYMVYYLEASYAVGRCIEARDEEGTAPGGATRGHGRELRACPAPRAACQGSSTMQGAVPRMPLDP